jgi:hypothetical protein
LRERSGEASKADGSYGEKSVEKEMVASHLAVPPGELLAEGGSRVGWGGDLGEGEAGAGKRTTGGRAGKARWEIVCRRRYRGSGGSVSG